MLQGGEALDFLDWGKKNLAANRACVARARMVLDDATARLRRSADLQELSHQRESLHLMVETSEHRQHVCSSQGVCGCANGVCVCGRISRVAVPTLMAAILAEAYEIGDPGQVQLDARELDRWNLPLDDFATRLGMVHRWKAETVVIYIGALRSALLDRHAPTPWDDL